MAIKFDITGDNSSMINALNGVQSKVAQTAKDVERSGASLEQMFSRVKNAANIALAGISMKGLVDKVVNTRGQFQQLEVAFTTMLGSAEKSQALMSQLVKTAATTPFDLQGVAEGAKQLIAYGTASEDVNAQLIKLGNIAAGLSLPLNDLVWLYGTTMTQGRMFTQDLRQFMGRGIPMAEAIAEVLGTTKDKVAGLVTAGKVTSDVVDKAIDKMATGTGKFAGLMDAQSKTITGQISNIEDSVDMMFNDIGKSSEGIINGALDTVSLLIDHYKEVGEVVLTAAAAFGEYKASLMLTAAVQQSVMNQKASIEATRQAGLKGVLADNGSTASTAATDADTAAREANTTAIDEQIAALQQSLAAKTAEARESYNQATTEAANAAIAVEAAQEKVAAAQEAYDAAVLTGNGERIAAAETELNTAQATANAAAKDLQAKRAEVHTAAETVETARTREQTVATQINTINTQAATTATGLWAAVTRAATTAFNSLKVAVMTNPFTAVIMGLTVIAGLVPMFISDTDDASDAAQRLGDSMNKAASDVTSMYAVLESSDATSKTHRDTLDELTRTAEEYGLTLDSEKDKTEQLIEKKEQLLGLIKEEAIEKQRANDIEQATDTYQKQISDIKENMMDDLPNALNAAQKSQFANLFDDSVIENLRAYQQAIEDAKQKTGSLSSAMSQKAITDYNKYMADLTKTIQTYGKAMGLSNGQIERMVIAAQKQYINLARSKDAYNRATATINYSAGAARKATEATDGFSNAQRLAATQTRYMRMSVDNLYSSIAQLLRNYSQNHINFTLTVDTAQVPKWMKSMLGGNINKAKAYNSVWAGLLDRNMKSGAKGAWVNGGKGTKATWMSNDEIATRVAQSGNQLRQIQQAQAQADTTKKTKTTKTKTPKTSTAKDDKAQLAKDEAAYKEELQDYEKQRRRDAEDMELNTRQANINLQEESTQRELAQAKLDFDKRKLEIKRGYEDLKAEKIKKAKELFNANPKNKGKVFNPASVDTSYTDAEKANNTAQNDAALKEYNDKVKAINQKRVDAERVSIQSYLKEYGDYQQKRMALTEEADDKIKKLNKNTELSDTDREYQIKSIQENLKKALADLDLEDLKKNINWGYIFGDLDHVDIETVSAVKEQLQQIVDTCKDMTPDQIKTVTDALEKLQEKMDLSQPIKTIKEARKEYKAALSEFNAAKTERNTARATGDTAAEKTATSKMTTASQAMTKAKNREKRSFDAVTETVKEYAQALSEAGGVIGGTAGDVLKLASSAITCGTSMVQGFEAVKNASSNLEKAVAILGIIQAAMQGLQIVMQIFGSSEDTTLTDYVDTMKLYIDLLNDSISDLNKSMTDTKNTMADTISYYGQLVDLTKQEATAIKSQSQVWLNSGASWKSHSEGIKIRKQIETDLKSNNAEVRAFNQQAYNDLNEYFRKATGAYAKSVKDFGRMDWIWNLSDEDIISLSKDTKAMSLLGDTLGGAISKYAKALEDAKDLKDTMTESLLTVSWDDFYDDFADVIKDMDSTSQDFAKNFAEYMRNALVKNLVASQYKDRLEALYKQAGEWAKDGTLEQHIDELKKQYQGLADSAQKDVETIDKITGYTATTSGKYSQSGTTGGWTSVGQESIDELNGRFAALQMSGESVSEGVSNIVALLTSLSSLSNANNATFSEFRNLMIMGNSYLEDIAKYSKSSYKDFGDKLDRLVSNTKNL